MLNTMDDDSKDDKDILYCLLSAEVSFKREKVRILNRTLIARAKGTNTRNI